MSIKNLDDNNFQQAINQHKGRCLVDCYATWCPPCKMLAPIIDELAEEIDTVAFFKLDVDTAPNTSLEYKISSIPTLLLFEDGKLIDRIVGFRSKAALEKILK